MSFIYQMTDTWNASGTVFNALFMNISNGAGGVPVGAAASKAMLFQNNSTNIFSVDVNGNAAIGQGVIDPSSILELALATGSTTGTITTYTGTSILSLRQANGTFAAPTKTLANGLSGFMGGKGHTGSAFAATTNAGIGMRAAEDFSPTANGMSLTFEVTPKTTTTRVQKGFLDSEGNFVLNNAAVVTTAIDGFLHIATCAGQPTGVPNLFTGRVPLVFDTTNSQFWIYTGGAWKQPKTPAAAALITWQ